MDRDLYEHYKAILAAERADVQQWENEKQQLEIRIDQGNASIARLLAKLNAYEESAGAMGRPATTAMQVSPPVTSVPDRLRYAGMSVRWAILYLMADSAMDSLTARQIAEALISGGVRTNGQSFNANVSAVVSVMVRKSGELERAREFGAYRITPRGREVWDTIKGSKRYRVGRLAILSAFATDHDHVDVSNIRVGGGVKGR
jgi:hypothetical protein